MVQQDSTLEMKHHQEHDTRCTSVQLCLQVSLGTKYLIQISIDFASTWVILKNLSCWTTLVDQFKEYMVAVVIVTVFTLGLSADFLAQRDLT